MYKIYLSRKFFRIILALKHELVIFIRIKYFLEPSCEICTIRKNMW